jgi:hypothetical protein
MEDKDQVSAPPNQETWLEWAKKLLTKEQLNSPYVKNIRNFIFFAVSVVLIERYASDISNRLVDFELEELIKDMVRDLEMKTKHTSQMAGVAAANAALTDAAASHIKEASMKMKEKLEQSAE